jgi:hypothetical protein
VPDDQHSRPGPVCEARKRRQGASNILVAMAVGLATQERQERVHYYETDSYAPYTLLYERKVLRD